ncbi:hypothetical protein O9H85_26360 [Paenibacillus filicis]|uniref:Uncharacterized protein n=1 Tax=Paenibacillus gyeongsangnamensis TaxID=3388067 RepID=A0ABT4QGJ0_9BACL|nr:hypothetical protein [Paenibacillus filicis]MCZ8515856.1 hypothetical protein [Paenibacillus filicis]
MADHVLNQFEEVLPRHNAINSNHLDWQLAAVLKPSCRRLREWAAGEVR